MNVLANLNPAQREAAQAPSGPLLILAGPGSGKTRVIAHRVAYLIGECGINPYNIMAVTFTNKAAREMKERLYQLVGDRLQQLTIGTFHALCAQILRKEIGHLGQDPHFVIYDDGDQLAVVRKVLKELNLEEKQCPPRALKDAIEAAKSELLAPGEYFPTTYWQEIVLRVYRRYQELLWNNKALDFDDLLFYVVRLFREHAEVLRKYQNRYLHILVDEFQDTNAVQYELVKLLGGMHRNVCVVGDPDQSIYAFRRADIRNILNFERDYPEARIVLLEQNYRSTQTILDVAHAVITPNRQRKEKRLWTENPPGLPVTVFEAYNEQEEAQYVVNEIGRLIAGEQYQLRNFAVMYRTNAQSRALEDAFVRAGLPYRLVGATRFYERREVKDVMAYLRLIHDPYDDVSLGRIINVPGRGVGPRTMAELERWAVKRRLPIYTALQLMAIGPPPGPPIQQEGAGATESAAASGEAPPLGPRARGPLLEFLALLDQLRSSHDRPFVMDILDQVLDRTGYAQYLQDGTEEGRERWENIQELRSVAKQYDERNPGLGLPGFLEEVALVSDVDNYQEKAEAVTLLTLHSAKGLEFPVVFIVGMEEGLLPHSRSLDNGEENLGELEEERRLCYVGITRSMHRLYLVHCFRRTIFGQSISRDPSRFLADVPRQLVQKPLGAFANGARGWGTPSGSRSLEPAAPAVAAGEFKVGDRVRHGMFGEGIVVEVKAVRDDVEVTVAFAGLGLKRLSLAYAPLEKAS
jgi:DNA helicase-2/ATP-dependent DNA helicase PcrA